MNRIGSDSNRETNLSKHFHLIAAVGPAGWDDAKDESVRDSNVL